MESNKFIYWVLGVIIAALGGITGYAADWNRDQDDRLAEYEKLLEKQKLILEHQIKINELQQQPQRPPQQFAPMPPGYQMRRW